MGDLEPVYDLFTITGEIITVGVTCHLHRNWWHALLEDKAALLERTEPERKKSTVEDPWNIREKNKKNEPSE